MPSFWFLPDTLMPSSSLLLHNQSIRKSSFLLFPKYDHKLSSLYKLLQPSTLVQTRVISLPDDGNNLMTLLQSFADSPFSRAPGQCSRFCSPHSLTCNSTDVAEREPWASAVKKSQWVWLQFAKVCQPLLSRQTTVNIGWPSSCFWSNMGQTAVLTHGPPPPAPPSPKQRLVSVHGTLAYTSHLQLLSFSLTHSILATARSLLFLEHIRPALPQIICAAWCFCHSWSCSSLPWPT